VNFITDGSVIGDVLVQHPKTRTSITGSKEVGCDQRTCRKDRSRADVDQAHGAGNGGKDGSWWTKSRYRRAVEGTCRRSGIKAEMFACSRAIVSEKIYDTFVQKLVERTKKITVDRAKIQTITWVRSSASRR